MAGNQPPPRQRQQARPGSNVAPGNFTGKETERLTEERRSEIVEAQQRVGTVNRVQEVLDSEAVHDPLSGQVVEVPGATAERVAAIQSGAEALDVAYADPDEAIDPLNQPPTPPLEAFRQPTQTEQAVRQAQPSGYEAAVAVVDEPAVQIVQAPTVKARVNTDIEDMTYGAGNIFSLRRGVWYNFPRDLYDHLDDRGFIYH